MSESELKSSSSSIVVTVDPEPILKLSFITTAPAPEVCKIRSALVGAVNVDPVAERSPKLLEPPPPVLIATPPGVTPSPRARLPLSTSTTRYPSSITVVAKL